MRSHHLILFGFVLSLAVIFSSRRLRAHLSYLLTIVAAEKVFRLVEPGTHTFSKFVNPEGLIDFFTKPLTPVVRPWVPGHMPMTYRRISRLRCAALCMFRGVVIGSWS